VLKKRGESINSAVGKKKGGPILFLGGRWPSKRGWGGGGACGGGTSYKNAQGWGHSPERGNAARFQGGDSPQVGEIKGKNDRPHGWECPAPATPPTKKHGAKEGGQRDAQNTPQKKGFAYKTSKGGINPTGKGEGVCGRLG